MQKKIDYKNALFQAFVGVLCYFLFIRKDAVLTKPKLIVGDVMADGYEYHAKYFKYSEYFDKYQIPQQYERNWWVLSRMLDKIREKWGSAIIITKGYEPPLKVVIENDFQLCLAVQIYPKNSDYLGLYNLIKSMHSVGQITPSQFILMDSKQIKLSVNG